MAAMGNINKELLDTPIKNVIHVVYERFLLKKNRVKC